MQKYTYAKKDMKKETKKDDFNIVDGVLGVMSGIGAVTVIKGITKALVKTKNPVVVASLAIFEVTAGIYWASRTAAFTEAARNVFGDIKVEVKRRVDDAAAGDDEGEEDDLWDE